MAAIKHHKDGTTTIVSKARGMTVAFKKSFNGKHVFVANALCSKYDNFSKKNGRDLARSRIDSKQYIVFNALGSESIEAWAEHLTDLFMME